MTDKILYVCSSCQEHSPEQCGRPVGDIRIAPDGRWLCDDCADAEFGFQHGFPKPGLWGPHDEVFRSGRVEGLFEAARIAESEREKYATSEIRRHYNFAATAIRANAVKLANEGDKKLTLDQKALEKAIDAYFRNSNQSTLDPIAFSAALTAITDILAATKATEAVSLLTAMEAAELIMRDDMRRRDSREMVACHSDRAKVLREAIDRLVQIQKDPPAS